MKLYATLETSRGKTVSISDNNEIVATLYDGNMKAYSVRIEWTDAGDLVDDDGNPLPDNMRVMGALITTREWRNRPQTNDRKNAQRKNTCAFGWCAKHQTRHT